MNKIDPRWFVVALGLYVLLSILALACTQDKGVRVCHEFAEKVALKNLRGPLKVKHMNSNSYYSTFENLQYKNLTIEQMAIDLRTTYEIDYKSKYVEGSSRAWKGEDSYGIIWKIEVRGEECDVGFAHKRSSDKLKLIFGYNYQFNLIQSL